MTKDERDETLRQRTFEWKIPGREDLAHENQLLKEELLKITSIVGMLYQRLVRYHGDNE